MKEKQRRSRHRQLKELAVDCTMSLATAVGDAGGRVGPHVLDMTLREFISSVAGQNSIRFCYVGEKDSDPELDRLLDDVPLAYQLQELRQTVQRAVSMIDQYGNVPGDHHRAWVLTEVVKLLLGEQEFADWLAEREEEDRPWDQGVAP